jgi:tetratricopeptide (TPR) repeat protein
LARAYGVLGFIAYAAGKDKAAAKKHFFAAKEADPSYVPARLYLGLIAKEEGATEQAIAELEAARKLSPRVHAPGLSLHEQLADLYVKAGKSAKAIEALRELARVDTTNARGLIRLGGLLADADRPAEAAAAYLEAIYIDPFDPQTHLAAARAYEAADAWEPAFREYGVAAILDRRSLAALVRRAQTLAVAGRTEAARLAVAAIRRADPTNPEAAKIERLLKK